MKRLRGCLVVAFIFGCGFLVGGFLGAAFGWVGMFQQVIKGGPRGARDIIVQRMVDDLKLNEDQSHEVREIVEDSARELGRATAGVRPEVEEILGRAEQRVRAVLNEGQRRKFDRFAERGRRRWQAYYAKREAEQVESTPLPAAAKPERTP